MSTHEADVMPEWHITDEPKGQIVLTVRHARNLRQYLSGNGGRASFVLTRRQALALSHDLQAAADRHDSG